MEPLFLDSPMHEKIWGGNRLKAEFGYDIPGEHTGEYWAISAHPNGCILCRKMENMLVSTWQSFTRIIQNFLGTPRLVIFPLLTKNFGC